MSPRPNLVLILVDDMGFSDLGCFGGEIRTPHLDALAANGQAYTQFYNTARCCPTRASVLTGLHPHQTGVGHMTNAPLKADFDTGLFGYRGFLNRHCVTLAEVLRDAGYHTYMSGKWHLGMGAPDQAPTRRGFERYYGIHAGACNYFRPTAPRGLFDGEAPVEAGEGYYTTDAFTDRAIRFLSEREDDRPFFLYLAYNAPHWPLQAPEEEVAAYRGKYRAGWDALRLARYERMVEKGIVHAEGCALSPRDPEVMAWDSLTEAQRDEMDLRMATYAAQVTRMDRNVGRLVAHLRESGCLDDTLILFLSDNGGCAEGGILGHGDSSEINQTDLSVLMLSYGRAWANLSNTPFRLYKRYVHEGGMATPLLAHWPEGIAVKGLIETPGYLPDIMPTFLELSGASYPSEYHGNPIPPLEGRSLVPVFRSGTRQEHEWMFWEHEDHCSVRWGRYKALQTYDTGAWALYDLERDRSELHDLAAERPDLVRTMAERWVAWAKSHCVMPKAGDIQG